MINLKQIFIDSYNEYVNKYKFTKHNSSTKYPTEKIYNALYKFTNNSVYFSRYTEIINGKYLNEIHNFLIKYSFYDILYKKIRNLLGHY